MLVDTRSAFRRIRVEQGGTIVRAEPGATVRATNARLAPTGRKLGPDPASEIACTIGGVVANNSSGMACGVERSTYRTLRSMTVVLASGTVLDTAAPDADERLRTAEPALHAGLLALRDELRASPDAVAQVRRLFAIKNTMGYGLNALLDHDDPVAILEHLVIGSEGTLAFVAEAVFATVPIEPAVATALLVFPDLAAATVSLPDLVAAGFATVELMDASSLAVAQRGSAVPAAIAALDVKTQAALLVELHAPDEPALAAAQDRVAPLLARLPLLTPAALTRDAVERAALWTVRKGLHTLVAGARPAGTTALLEDIAVPVERLLSTCEALRALFAVHGYEGSVIFGHAKDGNVHVLVNERFDDADHVARYERFTADMVDLVLGQGGTLKAEHGTGRIMAAFVERQYGPTLTATMWRIKRLFDPAGVLNPGVLLTEDALSYLHHLKTVPTVEQEVDRCVECGYCEPTCPSRDLTLTPRQRIVLRRDIDTGQLVRPLRAEASGGPVRAVWNAAARGWGPATQAAGVAMTVAKHVPAALPALATTVARSVLGDEAVPRWSPDLPGGGQARPATGAAVGEADAVLFAACVGTMFGPAEGGGGATAVLLALADRGVTVLDATTFVRRTVLPRLEVRRQLERVVLHPTCSTTHLGATADLVAIGEAVAVEATVPVDWGCCAYAGDRGMLHPELAAAATRREAAEVGAREYDAYASANRACELGMTAATGRPYQHVLELLEQVTRP